MEFRQLRYFIAVAEELHFGRAAKRLRMTGPPLSQQIQALERELGVELFIRGQYIELTAAGRAFLEQARCATEAANHAAQVAREVGRGTTRLRLGYPAAVASRCASMAVRMYRERFPETALETVVGHTGSHLTALSARQLDVAFVLSGIRSKRAGRFRPLHPERFLVAMPKEHSLARLRAVRVEHLAREPVVLFPRTLESSLGAVADGLGLAFTAESVVDLITVRGITFRPLAATVPALQVGVAWRRDATSKAVQRFLVIVDELARGLRFPNRDGRADRHNGHRHNGHRQGAARVTSS